MKNQYFPAPEVAAIGSALIEKHHEHLALRDYFQNTVRVEYIFSAKTPRKNDKEIWGTARKISGINSFIKRRDEMSWEPELSAEEIEAIEAIEDSGERLAAKERAKSEHEARMKKGALAFFLITISRPIWNFLDERARAALVDHELMHCTAELDDEGYLKLGTRGHDYEAFHDEVERYGLWHGEANQHFRSMKKGQMQLPLDEGEGVAVTVQTRIDGQMSEPVTLRSEELTKLDAMLLGEKVAR